MAPPLFAEMWEDLTRGVKEAVDVRVDHGAPFFERDIPGALADDEPGVIDEGVQAAEMSAKSWPEQVRVVAFVDEMPAAYRAADLAITRAGATTLAEQSLYGVPAILIPLPTSAENHQEFNARTVERRGAAAMVLQRELSGSRLARQVISLLKDSDRLGEMQKRALESAVPDAADRIVDAMTEEGLLRGDAG